VRESGGWAGAGGGRGACFRANPRPPCPPPVRPPPPSHKDGDLTVGESACIDRCTAKYWQATGIVGQLLGGSGAIGR
jgi:hypothetical protein